MCAKRQPAVVLLLFFTYSHASSAMIIITTAATTISLGSVRFKFIEASTNECQASRLRKLITIDRLERWATWCTRHVMNCCGSNRTFWPGHSVRSRLHARRICPNKGNISKSVNWLPIHDRVRLVRQHPIATSRDHSRGTMKLRWLPPSPLSGSLN
jgi:hypothetical protein